MERKKNSYFKLGVVFIVKCDEVSNVSCLKNIALNFAVEFPRLKSTLSFFEVLTGMLKIF